MPTGEAYGVPWDPATRSGLRALLERHGLAAKKRLGQNFLVDGNVLDKIVDAAELTPEERVLEIGPGAGALTLRLAARVNRVVAVEIDPGLCRLLGDVLTGAANVELICGDALDVDLQALLSGARHGAKAVCNLPYYITSPLLFRLLDVRPPLKCVIALMQREVADRLTAKPGTKAYGALSVTLGFRASAVERVGVVGPSVFVPRPEVESAIVRIRLRDDVDDADAAALTRVVRAAFAHRRKTLRRALSTAGLWPDEVVERALAHSGIDPARRGESLSVSEFRTLAHALGDARRV